MAVLVYVGSDVQCCYANTAAVLLCGASTVEDVLGRSVLDLFVGGERTADLQMVALLMAGEAIRGFEARIAGFTGHGCDVEVNTGAVTWGGKPAVHMTLIDVTARAAARAVLRASEQRCRVLFDTASHAMVESLLDGTILAVNPAMCTLLGYADHELVGQPIEILTKAAGHPDTHRAGVPDAVAELVNANAPCDARVQRTLWRKDGTRLEVVVTVASLRDETDQPHRAIVTVVDVTERVADQGRSRARGGHFGEREALTKVLVDGVEVGLVACDAQGHLTTSNAAAQLWHGIDADGMPDPAGLAAYDDLYKADGATALPTEQIPLLVALRTGSIIDAEIVIAPKGRPATRVLCNGQALRDTHGTVIGAVVAMHDITALRAGEHTLREQATLHDAILAASPDLIFLLDPVGNRLVWSSGTLAEMLGYTDTQIHQLGSATHTTLVHPDDVGRVHAANLSCRGMDDGQVLLLRYRVKAADGHYRWLSRRATPFRRDTHGEITQLLAVTRDVTDIVEVEQRLAQAALHDPLTGLPNRRLLSTRLAHTLALHRTARTGLHIAILFCDLDGFKNVNDTAGHDAGDAVLIATAERLHTLLRPPHTVARVGGDEFVILLELPRPVTGAHPTMGSDHTLPTARHDPRAQADAVAARIEQALREPVMVNGIQYRVTVSIGITLARAGDDAEVALRDADNAMYQAKAHGKNRHQMADITLPAGAVVTAASPGTNAGRGSIRGPRTADPASAIAPTPSV